MTEDPATIAKLNRVHHTTPRLTNSRAALWLTWLHRENKQLESAWQAAHEGFKRTNKKIILSVNELSTQVKPALQEYLQAVLASIHPHHTMLTGLASSNAID